MALRRRLPALCTQVLAIVAVRWPDGWRRDDAKRLAGSDFERPTDLVPEMKKGLALTRPSIKIAGAQEGTRTPTELPAST